MAQGETTLETSEDENYTRNEWKVELHSKRVKKRTTLETSEKHLTTKYFVVVNVEDISKAYPMVDIDFAAFLRILVTIQR